MHTRLRLRFIEGALAAMLVAVLGTPDAKANYLAFEAPTTFSPSTGPANNPVNLGLFFTVSSTITVDALGFYDIPNLTSGETLTLYTSTGTALTSVVVPLTGILDDGYLMQSITPYTLTAGQYAISAFTGNNPWEFYTSVATGTGITFNFENYDYASTPTFPSGGVSQAAGVYYGPTFDVQTGQSTAPEPGAWMMAATGLSLLGVARWRRIRRA
jgi:hypothetical protein